MYHDGAMLLAVLAHVLELEALGHLEVQLDGAALPGPANAVGEVEVELRAIEGAVSLVDLIGLAQLLDGGFQRGLSHAPGGFVAHVVLGHGGELDLVAQGEGRVYLVEDADNALDLVLHLFRGHEDVRVVLGEAAYAEEPVQRAGKLMPVDDAQLGHAHGQVSVRVRLAFVYQHAAGAVHGLDRIVLAVDDGGIHVVLIVVPVAAAVPELLVEDDGRGYLDVAVSLVHLAPVLEQRVLEDHAVRQEEREAGPLVREHEQAELTSELAVVTLLRLFKTIQIGLKFLLFEKTCAVDPLEHLPAGIAAPVCAGAAHEFYGVALYPAGAVHVRAGAEVGEFALLIETDDRVLRQVLYELHLVGLVLLAHEGKGLRAGQLKALYGQLFLADLAHLGLDLLEHLGGEGHLGVYVVIKAVLDRGADGQLGLRIQALYRLGEDVARAVPVGIAVFFVFKSVFFLVHDYPPVNGSTPAPQNGTGVRF